MLTSPHTQQWIEIQAKAGAPWKGTMDNPKEYLEELGWEAKIMQAGEEGANFGRWTYPITPILEPEIPHNWYVTVLKIG